MFQNCFELGPALRLLTCRPNKLVVAPDEGFPAIRPFGKAPRTQPIEINGMSAMHKLVYKMYMDKIEEMEDDKEKMKELSEMLENPQDMEDDDVPEEDEAKKNETLIENEVPDAQVPKKHQQKEAEESEPMES